MKAPWDSQDIYDVLMHQRRPPPWGDRAVLESGEFQAVHAALVDRPVDSVAALWWTGFQGRPQGVLMPLQLNPTRQDVYSDGQIFWTGSHRGDH